MGLVLQGFEKFQHAFSCWGEEASPEGYGQEPEGE